MHMPRAVGVFRKAGFPVEAYPVDWNTKGWIDVAEGPVWPVRGLDMTDFAMKEWTGLFAYWLAGYTPELLPGPAPDAWTPLRRPDCPVRWQFLNPSLLSAERRGRHATRGDSDFEISHARTDEGCEMSLDMTMGTREAALDSAASRSRRKRLPPRGSGCRTSSW